MNHAPLLEICLDSFESAVAAQHGGAQRVELCANLLEGGITPSAGLIRSIRENLQIALSVMIRPRGGDFLYTDSEFLTMQHDIHLAKELGADAIVLGLLNPDGTVDLPRTCKLVELAHPLPVTFHRAIDVTPDIFEALEAIIASGAARILTSGSKPSVVDGAPTVARLVEQAGDRIIIMPGGGIRRENIVEIAQKTDARELHIALNRPKESGMRFRKNNIAMGSVKDREYFYFRTEEDTVREVVQLLNADALHESPV